MDYKVSKYSLLEAKAKLESYCAYQERCMQEVQKKLVSWSIFYEDQDILISDLISNNFLNEERFAKAYAGGKFRMKKWGKQKIKNHLKQKNISNYSIKKGLEEIELDDYLETITYLADKKWASLQGDKWEKITKVNRFLFNKGYENEYIQETLKPYQNE